MKCKKCGKEIDKKAVVCNGCGCKIKKPIYKKWWVWVIFICLLSALGNILETQEIKNIELNEQKYEQSFDNIKQTQDDESSNSNDSKIVQSNEWWDDYVGILFNLQKTTYYPEAPQNVSLVGFSNNGEYATIEYNGEYIKCKYNPENKIGRDYYPVEKSSFYNFRLYNTDHKGRARITIYPEEPHYDPYFDSYTNLTWIDYYYNFSY